jgi:hypothetical protein
MLQPQALYFYLAESARMATHLSVLRHYTLVASCAKFAALRRREKGKITCKRCHANEGIVDRWIRIPNGSPFSFGKRTDQLGSRFSIS